MTACEGAQLCARNGEKMHLLGVALSGDVHGVMFEAQVEQRFVNPQARNVEVVYSFPLPWGAVLLGVDVVLGGQRLGGAVVASQQAEAQYEDALGEGHAAILLQENHDGSFSLNLGNLAAGETCNVTLRYAQTLQWRGGALRLLIPTVIAPRHGDMQREGGLQPHQVPEHCLAAQYAFELTLRLHGALARARVSSPSHPVTLALGRPSAQEFLTIGLARSALLDRDFVLVLDQMALGALVVTAPDTRVPGHQAVLASFDVRLPVQPRTAQTIKMLVDCSGSMAGDSLHAARRALQAVVQQLRPSERFALSRFGSSVQHRGRAPWRLTEATRLAAQRWIGALQADLGGTEMEAALASTFALPHGEGTAGSDILLVTDGEISAIDDTIATAQRSGHRLFIVAIGSSPAESHLRRLARASGGACDFVAPGEDVEPAVLRMFTRLRSPRLAGVQLQWPAGSAVAWQTPLDSAVFDGDTVNVFALLRGQPPAGALRLLGQGEQDTAACELGQAPLTGDAQAGDALARMAAAQRLQELDDAPAQAIRLALDYQLVTRHSSFVLIHERCDGQQAVQLPQLHKVAQMVPAGWGGLGSVDDRHDLRFSRKAAFSPSMALPAVWRVSRAAGTGTAAPPATFAMDDLVIPEFLRRKEQSSPDRAERCLWASDECYEGLTPLGLAEELRSMSHEDWPCSYEELHDLGVGQWVLDWLQWRIVLPGGAQLPERAVVTAFVHLIAGATMDDGPAALHRPASSIDAAFAGVEAQLQAALTRDLAGMTANEWPQTVLSPDSHAYGDMCAPTAAP